MKTNYFTSKTINMLFSLIALSFFPFISNAQLNVSVSSNVGIGTASPGHKLEVNGGNINAATNTNGYRIAGSNVLWNNNKAGCIYVGQGGTSSSSTGTQNTFAGFFSGAFNSSGGSNTAVGSNAGYANTTGSGNTYVGYIAGNSNIACANSTFLGHDADADASYSNVTAIGYGARAKANNQVRIGNNAVSGLFFGDPGVLSTNPVVANMYFNTGTGELQRATSSARYKTDIVDIEINSSSIYDLRPVSFTSVVDHERHFGLIAEEVAEVIPQLTEYAIAKNVIPGSESEEVIPESVQYALLGVLLLKEVQKHQDSIVSLNQNRLQHEEEMARLEDRLSLLEDEVRTCCAAPKSLNIQDDGTLQGEQGRNENGTNAATQVIELAYSDNIILYQNIPNPFGEETTINYYLPQTVNSAKMVFYDHMGKVIKEEVLAQKGNASVIIKSAELASGVYSYSLVVDEKVAGTKMMVKAK